jgi:hypothetical protein
MACMLKDLEALVEESVRFLAAPAADIPQLLSWGARRQAVFARLQNEELELQRDEQRDAVKLLEQLRELDASLIVRLEKELNVLEQEIYATNKMRQLLKTHAVSNAPILLQRVA